MAQMHTINPTTREARALIAPAVLEGIAAHARAGGQCLIVAGPDGRILWSDPAAAPFFQDYVLAALRRPEIAGAAFAEYAGRAGTTPTPTTLDVLPGARLCAMPYVERRQVVGIVMLACRRDDPAARLCLALGVEADWLSQQAESLPAHGPESLATTLACLISLLADRQRLRTMEGEIHSLSTQLANAYEELALIEQVSGGMRINRGGNEFFRNACLDVMQVVSLRTMGVALWHEKYRQEPIVYGEAVVSREEAARLAAQLDVTLGLRRTCLLVNDLAGDPAWKWLSSVAHQLLAVPLLRQDQVLGCLFALDKTAGDFDSVDAKLLGSIANECAIYLENAVLFNDVNDLVMGLLHSLTSAVDAKDAYTCGHSERVALVARHLASRVGLSDEETNRVYMAGLLHDVGKIGIPESLLQKTGRLTPEEFEQIKKHPQIGARILDDVKQLEDIVPGVLHHHERYDGKGYPKGLSGRDIPIAGRIICLADCFDAMTSSRTYRKALPLEVALCEIRRCAGTQFDPALAEAFLQISPEQFRLLLREHEMQARKLIKLQESLRAA